VFRGVLLWLTFAGRLELDDETTSVRANAVVRKATLDERLTREKEKLETNVWVALVLLSRAVLLFPVDVELTIVSETLTELASSEDELPTVNGCANKLEFNESDLENTTLAVELTIGKKDDNTDVGDATAKLKLELSDNETVKITEEELFWRVVLV